MQHKNSIFHYGFVIVACCFLMIFLNVGLVYSCAGLFYVSVAQELKVSVGDLGLYVSFIYALSSLTLSLSTHITQRFSYRQILTATCLLLALSYFGFSQAQRLWHFYLAGSFVGICMAFQLYLSWPTLINRWFKKQVGTMIGLCSAGSGLGGVLLSPVVIYGIEHYGWRNTYLFFGFVILAVMTPLMAFLLRDTPEEKQLLPFGETSASTPSPSDNAEQSNAPIATSPQPVGKLFALCIFGFFIIAISMLNLFLPKYLNTFQVSNTNIGWVASAVMVGVTVGKILLGIVGDKNSFYSLILMSFMGGMGLLLFIFFPENTLLMCLAGVGFGFAYAGPFVQTPILVRQVYGREHYAPNYAKVSLTIALGGTLASGGWGKLAEASSYTTIFFIGLVLLLACFLLGIYALRRSAQ